MGAKKPPMPFSDTRLLNVLQHTFWFLPTVASCHAMKNLINQKQILTDYVNLNNWKDLNLFNIIKQNFLIIEIFYKILE